MSDLIDRQAALDAIMGQPPEPHYPSWYAAQIEKIPAVQPDHNADVSKKVADEDCISRQMAIEAMTNTLWHYPNECYRNLNEYEFAKGLVELGLKSVPSMPLPEPYRGGGTE